MRRKAAKFLTNEELIFLRSDFQLLATVEQPPMEEFQSFAEDSYVEREPPEEIRVPSSDGMLAYLTEYKVYLEATNASWTPKRSLDGHINYINKHLNAFR